MMENEIKVEDKRFKSQSPDQEFHAPVASQNEIMMEAVRKGFGKDQLEVLKGMFELQREAKREQAKEEYVQDMATFKANPPDIIKSKKAGFEHADGKGRTEYSYADLAIVTAALNEGLSKHGFSLSWSHAQDADNITVTCICTHRLGHSERTSLTAKADQSGKKNPIQAIASTISYLEKYTALGVTGLAAKGMDDDGNAAGGEPEYIDTDQVTEINDLLNETGANRKVFLKVAKAESVETILKSQYQLLINQLHTKRDKMRQPGDD